MIAAEHRVRFSKAKIAFPAFQMADFCGFCGRLRNTSLVLGALERSVFRVLDWWMSESPIPRKLEAAGIEFIPDGVRLKKS